MVPGLIALADTDADATAGAMSTISATTNSAVMSRRDAPSLVM